MLWTALLHKALISFLPSTPRADIYAAQMPLKVQSRLRTTAPLHKWLSKCHPQPAASVSFEDSFAMPLVAQTVKRLPTMQETWVQALGRKDPLEKEMATHSSILAWKIPWIEEPSRLQFTGLQRVGHDWATSLSLCNVPLQPYWLRDSGRGAQHVMC